MQIDYTNKGLLVTGGTRGVGRAIVEGFLESLKYLLVCYKECNR